MRDWLLEPIPRVAALAAFGILAATAIVGFWRLEQNDARLERADARLERTDARIQDLREKRVVDEARTNRLLCLRQNVTLTRLRHTKVKIKQTNTILRDLILGVSARPDPDPEDADARRALMMAVEHLGGENRELTRGIFEINDALDGNTDGRVGPIVDCDRLPSDRPFQE